MKRPTALTLAATALALAASTAGNGPVPAPHSPEEVRFLALGDSYTIGEAVGEAERWPAQLAVLLAERGYRADLQVIARTGWTTDELWSAIQGTEIGPPYDLVTLLIGVNNQYRGRDSEEYREQFRFLLGKAVEYAGGRPGRVMVLSIPDWGMTPFGGGGESAKISLEIDRFNAINRQESERVGVHYVDITPESRAQAHDPSFIAVDGLHPSGKMYADWAALALPATLKALSR